jgi:hypothetical protein
MLVNKIVALKRAAYPTPLGNIVKIFMPFGNTLGRRFLISFGRGWRAVKP